MASSGAIALIFSVIFFTAANAESYFVTVECSRENVGQYGQESLLNCAVKTKHEAANAQIRVVVLKKDRIEEPLLLYHQGDMTPTPGYKFADPSWKDTKNISLLITNTVVPDEGTYSCHVVTDSGDSKNVASLKVKAKYRKPKIYSTSEKLTPNADSTLTCESEGGYPQGQIRWFDKNGYDWTKSSEMESIWANSGLYQLKSKLPLLNGHSFSEITCVVFNSTGGREEETTYILHAFVAKYSEPKIYFNSEKLTSNAASTLTCESESGYPLGQIRWFDEGGYEWTKSSEMEVIQTDDGLYQLKSKLPLLNGHQAFSRLTCVVFNAIGGKEEETTYEIPRNIEGTPNHEASKIVAPIVVIGLLLVGLVVGLVVLLWKKLSRQTQKPSAPPLMGPYKHGAGCPREDCRQAEKMMDKECIDSLA